MRNINIKKPLVNYLRRPAGAAEKTTAGKAEEVNTNWELFVIAYW
jgi:hypothetical protein